MLDENTRQRIQDEIDGTDVVLFMKGYACLSAMRFLRHRCWRSQSYRREVQGYQRA